LIENSQQQERKQQDSTPTAAKDWQRAGSTAETKQHKDHGRLQQQGACNSRHVLVKEGKPITTMTPATTVTPNNSNDASNSSDAKSSKDASISKCVS
jgi:hypothetical protein